MPENLTESALLAIAVAASVQTMVVVAACVATWITMRRLQASLRAESAELHLRLDEALVHVRAAATSVSQFSSEAGDAARHAGRVIDDVSGAVRLVASTVAAPRALLAAGAAAGARRLLRRWRAGRAPGHS
ncbi:MAG: hypothetical protein R2745_08260 [Vicinamibacterales bacterium]